MLQLPKPMYVTTDAVAVSCLLKEGLKVLLIRRAKAPFERFWALPGGFVEEEEDLLEACTRELEEETSVQPTAMVQLGAWGKPGRDPRGRNVSIAYLVAVRPQAGKLRAGSDAAQAEWYPFDALPSLAFDHEDIVVAGMKKLRSLIVSAHLIFAMVPETFRLDELRDALTAVRGELVTAQEALAFLKRARIVKQAGETPREGETYRCTAADFLTPLR
jgi:8-oxo-dGTP diphosphatase